MTRVTYTNDLTGLVVIDAYNDLISEKLPVAEEKHLSLKG